MEVDNNLEIDENIYHIFLGNRLVTTKKNGAQGYLFTNAKTGSHYEKVYVNNMEDGYSFNENQTEQLQKTILNANTAAFWIRSKILDSKTYRCQVIFLRIEKVEIFYLRNDYKDNILHL